MKRVVIIGGGTAGTFAANRIRKFVGRRDVKITLIDENGLHTYHPNTLLAMVGMDGNKAVQEIKKLVYGDLEVIVDKAKSVDLGNRFVETEGGKRVEYDYLVIASGARIDLDAIPGFREGAFEFHTYEGATRLYEALRNFKGGKILVGIGGLPYRCPPSPYEATLMIFDFLKKRGVKNFEIEFLSPIQRLYPVPQVDEFLTPIFEKKGINWHTFVNVEEIKPNEKKLVSMEGDEFKYDLLVLVPPYKGSDIEYSEDVKEDEGWLKTDKFTLNLGNYDDVYVVGDATNLPTSKAGSVAEFEAEVVAKRIAEDIHHGSANEKYNGRTLCIVATGIGKAVILKFDYNNPPRNLKETRFNWMLKKMYRWYYFNIALKDKFKLNSLFLKII